MFAIRHLPRSTVIGTFRGTTRWIWDIPEGDWPYAMQVDYDRYVLPKRNGVVWYLNHSCEPNCYMTGRRIVTAREIAEGEELTFDYSSDTDWPGFSMPCSCGSAYCRKVIRAYRHLPREVKVRYGKRVAGFIRREYLRGPAVRQGPV